MGNAALVNGIVASGKNNAWVSEAVCVVEKCTGLADLKGRQFRWNGTAWRSVTLPKAYAGGMVVPASPVSDWIVGAVPVSKSADRDVVLHSPTAKEAWLFGLTAVGGPSGGTYASHYTGGTWRPVRVPFVGDGASASSSANVWVSGYLPADDGAGVMAFNGRQWRTVPLPPLPSSLVYTGSGNIAAVSPSNVWLEIERTSNAGDSTPYLLHWTGAKWTSIKIHYGLDDMGGAPIAQDGNGGVWLILADIKDPAHEKVFLLHYLNGAWTRVPVPTTAGYDVLGRVALTWIPGTRSLWAAALELSDKSPKSAAKLLILKYGP